MDSTLIGSLMTGGIALVLGLWRGMPELVEDLRAVFDDAPDSSGYEPGQLLPGQIWFAVAGAAIIILAVARLFLA